MVNLPYNSYIAFATAPNIFAYDGTGKHGVFTKYILENISQKGFTVEDMFKNVRISVFKDTKGRQLPWERSSLVERIYLAGKNKVSIDYSKKRRPFAGF